MAFFWFLKKIVRCPPLRRWGLHDVGHVGAATGRGVKPRQAIPGGTSWATPSAIATLGVFRVRAKSPRSRHLRNERQLYLQIMRSKKLQCIIIFISTSTIYVPSSLYSSIKRELYNFPKANTPITPPLIVKITTLLVKLLQSLR